jgi:endonuclease-3 related protein
MHVMDVYDGLRGHFSRQVWWTKRHFFHPREFEICVGAILTQNTNWKNVEKALENMSERKLISPESIAKADVKKLEDAVRPSGFYRQKAERLRLFSEFVMSLGSFDEFAEKVTREQLLGLKGLGPETADSILLYALGRPVFVIDAYTKRIFRRLGFRPFNSYEDWRNFFEQNVPRDRYVYMEFHALIVELAKHFCRPKPLCPDCPLAGDCAKKI